MEPILTYMMKLVICSGFLYLYYLIALRNKRFHVYNRFYLLFTFVISLLIPFIHFDWISVNSTQHLPVAAFARIIVPEHTGQSGHEFPITAALLGIYIVVSSFMAIVFLSRIYWIYKAKKNGKIIPMQGVYFIETSVPGAPFSFMNNLFWKKGISLTDENGKRIFVHELTHIQQKHSYDSLFTQITICICWINPFFWLLDKELNVVHEFIADAASVEKDDTESFALMLLHTHNEGRYLNPAHSFFNSSIKRRLAMIQSSKKHLTHTSGG